jgi:hypothetical protein
VRVCGTLKHPKKHSIPPLKHPFSTHIGAKKEVPNTGIEPVSRQ